MVIETVRRDLAITIDSDDDFNLSDSSSIVNKTKATQITKRTAIIPFGEPRMTKRRMAELEKIRLEANNTFERNEMTQKKKSNWQKKYDQGRKRRIGLKLIPGQTIENQQLDNISDPKFRINLDNRTEIKTKPKPKPAVEEAEDVKVLKEKLYEAERQLLIAQRNIKERDQLIGHLRERITIQSNTLTQLRMDKFRKPLGEKADKLTQAENQQETSAETVQKSTQASAETFENGTQTSAETVEIQVDGGKMNTAPVFKNCTVHYTINNYK